ncbi:MAG: lipopolysaccharide heptosyltransferase II [Phycisphaerae bacterium]|nr:lipopolysaccharide heptosyltransferase II [Phycisphaerae bacterium]
MPTVLVRRALKPRSILVVLPTWVGDFVMATPTLRALRTRFPDARITFVAEPNLRDLIRGGDWMNDVALWPEKHRRKPWHREYRSLVAHLRKQRFDWAVLLPNSARSALLAFLAGAKRRIGYNRDGRGLLLTDRLPVKNYAQGRYAPLPLVEYYADLAEALLCDRPGDNLELFTTPDAEQTVQARLKELGIADRHPLVILGPGAKFGASKCWLPDRYAAVADRLVAERGAAVVVTCGPGEEPIARQIGAAMRERGFVCDAPRFSLGEMKSLVRRADLLICNDAGLRHFAKAFDVPVVTVFGPTHPEWTATSYADERIVRIDVDCGPCQQRVCPLGHLKCMEGVTVDMVFGAACDLIDLRHGVGAVSAERQR